MKNGFAALAAMALAAPAWAGCPPECPYRLGIESTLAVTDGEITREERLTFSRDFGVGDILGSQGTIRVGLSAPFLISDPGTKGATLDVSLLWSPLDAFTPAAIQLRTPLTPLSEWLDSDPEEEGRPRLRVILPRPISWDWLPSPFLGGGPREVSAGLIFNFLSAADTLPGANGFMVDRLRVDYQISAVPEPQSWALWIAGLGLAGVVLRQRKAISA
ncbi:PEP-CTERM sorting domain-containing protein [Sandarakinorhabdus sp. AAP62]|uniref:PEP-CTERM sorting domain-containing protein n=1 Tax=Sandarakinorhabdus sp. AAP62 TaxID=1248916 RepID=UPI0002FBA375|nr:PEP-CTERM sorting domain-containing protein [Sandarakinorhabdus sp. AAP62]